MRPLKGMRNLATKRHKKLIKRKQSRQCKTLRLVSFCMFRCLFVATNFVPFCGSTAVTGARREFVVFVAAAGRRIGGAAAWRGIGTAALVAHLGSQTTSAMLVEQVA